MAKFWNFIFFQAGWFACVLGAAHHQEIWSVAAVFVYLALHIWRSGSPSQEFNLFIKVLLYGVASDSILMYLGLLDFGRAWPAPYLSPIWMWALWLLVASTLNGSLSWLQGKPVLGALLGAIAGPLSYEAGVRMGGASWGPGGQIAALGLISLVWLLAMPLFLRWSRSPENRV